jgi:hypothetical protein
MTSSVISLSRVLGGWRDRARRYQVIIDGAQAGWIKRGERLELPVAPGRHSVWLEISWARSPQLDVDVGAGETVSLECEPGTSMPLGAGSDVYIQLRRVG